MENNIVDADNDADSNNNNHNDIVDDDNKL